MFQPNPALFDPSRAAGVFDAIRTANSIDSSVHPLITQSMALDSLHDIAIAMVEAGGRRREAAGSWAEDIMARFRCPDNEYGMLADETEPFMKFQFCEVPRSFESVRQLQREIGSLAPSIEGYEEERLLLDFFFFPLPVRPMPKAAPSTELT